MSPSPGGGIAARQLWNLPTTTTSTVSPHCTPFTLPSGGILSLADSVITLTTNVVFQPECTGAWTQADGDYPSTIADLRDPFYASTTPQTYVIAAATVISWILVFMLVITPRTSFFGTPIVQPGLGGGHGIIGGANGGLSSSIGVGSRPWLQKIAALTVAISLTIATADTFEALEEQYAHGFMDATSMRDSVMGSMEIRVTRVISDIFLWLAQVQTLIRLFPRHKEKVLIKWIGFALILCDTTFSCLNSFYVNTPNKPRHFVDAIPALSYLFELALGLLYAAWVIYYAVTKRRYAFYHAKMRSIILIALLSMVAILTPVVFFVTDVCNADVAGWGDYFRWVGAAAASVIVWEWVERIEALEREEKKDGILGREIFDGDEMLDAMPSDDIIWSSRRRGLVRIRRNGEDGDGEGGGNQLSTLETGLQGFANRFRKKQPVVPKHFPLGRSHSNHTESATEKSNRVANANGHREVAFGHLPKRSDELTHANGITGITPPPAIASPVSRADTTSAASTVYVVRYDNEANVPRPIRRRVDTSGNTAEAQAKVREQRRSNTKDPEKDDFDNEEEVKSNRDRQQHNRWHGVSNPFKRKRASPPAEVQKARDAAIADGTRAVTPAHNFSRWDVKNRLGVLAAETGERFRDRTAAARRQPSDNPITVIPAQPRGSERTWSPEVHTQRQHVRTVTGGRQNEERSPADVSNATTLTSNSLPAAQAVRLNSARPPRADDISPLGAGGAGTPVVIPPSMRRNNTESSITTIRRSPQDMPPRADDISPVAGSTAPVIVPAPRRSPLRAVVTPLDEDGPASNMFGRSPGLGLGPG